MFRTSDTNTPGRGAVVLTWLGRGLLLLLIAVSLLVATARLFGAGSYIGYLASRGTIFDVWGVLHTLDALFSLAAIVGAGFALLRRKLLLAFFFSLLAWPVSTVIEGSRCDTEAGCRTLGWAAMPASFRDWSIRIRPVTDRNEADNIASAALSDASSSYSTYNAQRFDDHWIVATIDQNGRPGPSAVKIDTRTAATSFVPCPASRMLCGMERPVVSDGRRVFSSTRLGLAATFPTTRSVCTARPADEARGFYAMVRPADIPCDIVDPSRTLGLEALTARTVAEARLEPCRPLSPAILKAFGGAPPGFAGHRSVACEEVAGGQIAISVFAFARPRPESAAPTTLYEAWMLTDLAHLAEDVRSFEAFLTTARIGAPAPSR